MQEINITSGIHGKVLWGRCLSYALGYALFASLCSCGGGSPTSTAASPTSSGGSSSSPQSGQVSVSLSPSAVTVQSGQEQPFLASVSGTNDTSVQWKASVGVIDASGVYTAPQTTTEISDVVTATSDAQPSVVATSHVTVEPSTSSPPPPASTSIPTTFFSISGSSGMLFGVPWPKVQVGGFRLWDTQTGWEQLNPQSGVYSWQTFDMWLEKFEANSVDATYTFGRVPQWASSKPNDHSCRFGPGSCDPPDDLNSDGSGSDDHWRTFVTAIANHSKNSAHGHVKRWEMWNEPQNSFYWSGTTAQLVRMTRDAWLILKAVDPDATVVSPGTGLVYDASHWTSDYLANGALPYLDVIAFHGYVEGKCPDTEPDTSVLGSEIANFRAMLASHGASDKPLWDTESSWGNTSDTCFTDADSQAAFVAQSYLLHWSNQIDRYYWYQWDNPGFGTLWKQSGGSGQLLKPGMAYEQVYDWLVGASLTSPCAVSGTLWSCTLSRPAGYQGLILWDTSQGCGGKTCTTVPFSVDASYVTYRDLNGNANAVTGQSVPVGAKPILVQNQPFSSALRKAY